MIIAMGRGTAFAHFTLVYIVMLCLGILFLWLGIVKKYEPFLLVPLGIGCILVNIPGTGLMAEGAVALAIFKIAMNSSFSILYFKF